MTKIILSAVLATSLIAITPSISFADQDVPDSELVEIADVSVGLNGLVCDFCSIALNKTFKKSKAVSGTYVDLDTKILSVVFNEGERLDDETIIKMVKKAGYSVTKIARKDGSEYVPPVKDKKKKS